MITSQKTFLCNRNIKIIQVKKIAKQEVQKLIPRPFFLIFRETFHCSNYKLSGQLETPVSHWCLGRSDRESLFRGVIHSYDNGAALDKVLYLRDRLVWGVKDTYIQKKLLAERELTLATAIQIAQGSETAEKNLREMGSESHKEGVHYVQKQTPKPIKTNSKCYRCGKTSHSGNDCPYKDFVCRGCHKVGHLQKMCRAAKGRPNPKKFPRHDKYKKRAGINQARESGESDDEDFLLMVEEVGGIHRIYQPPIKVPVSIEGTTVCMELDTGASVSLVSESQYKQLWPGRSLDPSDINLQTYSKEPLVVMGSFDVEVVYDNKKVTLPLVVQGNGPLLFGRNWLNAIKLNWSNIHYTQAPGLQDLLAKYPDVFQKGLGTYQGQEASLVVDADAVPRFNKARRLPYAMRTKVEEELERLVQEGTLKPVDYAEWAAPIVAVLKSDRTSVRICGDFRMTVNPVSKLHRYPLPKVEDLFATLADGKIFTKLDLTQAYQQLKLDTQSQNYVVINTLKGLFQYTRLPFGVSSAPGIFQKTMETLLQGIAGVVVYLDDILISSATEAENLKSLEEVLKRLSEAGLRAKRGKCTFMAPSVEFLGHLVDAKGIRPLPEKVRAVQQAPTPTNVTELRSYIGLISYYGKFLPNLATRLTPLYKLLNKDVPWKWSSEQELAFNRSKQLLTSTNLLAHYNPQLPIVLACDASAYGIGAVLAHQMPDGTERPIAYASRTLNSAERNYSQLEKEGLSCVFGVKKFYAYLFGRKFTLITDHKPLLSLLSGQKPTSLQASARIRRWSLALSMYEYELKFRNTTAHGNADALSRLPLTDTVPDDRTPPELVLLLEHLDSSPITAAHIKEATRRDPELSTIHQYVQQGWPHRSAMETSLMPFYERREELSVHDGCLLWGNRVVVPKTYRGDVLVQLHEGHPGTTRMKGLSRMYVWWPGISKDVEETVQDCIPCQQQQSKPPVAPLHPWAWPTRPWARLHIDYAGPIHGQMFLIIIDAHSKWIEAIPTSGSTSRVVIEELRFLFSQFGLPECVVSDNGTCFTSAEFKGFLKKNGINQILSAPYHPSTNGLAERAVQVVKKGLKKETKGSMRSRLATVLFAYRLTAQSTTGQSPSELLLGRRPRSRLDLLKPNTAERVERQQAKQVKQHDNRARERSFEPGDLVYVRNYQSGNRWLPGVIQEKTGPVSFRAKMQNGQVRRCHVDQVRNRTVEEPTEPEEVPIPNAILPDELTTPYAPQADSTPGNSSPSPEVGVEPPVDVPSQGVVSKPATAIKVYPKRNRKTVDRYEPKW